MLDWRATQPDRAEIAVLVLSDHGHVSGSRKLDLAAELRRGGFTAAAGLAPGVEVVVAPAAAPGLWLRDPALAPALASFFAAQPWAAPLLVRDPRLLPDALPLATLDAAHLRSADIILCFAGDEGPDHYGLPGRAPFDTPGVLEGGGVHGGLHRRELATVLVAEGGPFRHGATVQAACDLADMPRRCCICLALRQTAWKAGSSPKPVMPRPMHRRSRRRWCCRAASDSSSCGRARGATPPP